MRRRSRSSRACASSTRGGIGLIDCQVHTEHLERFGAYEVPRLEYLQMLARALDEPTRRGAWKFEIDLAEFAKTGGFTSSE